MIRIKGTDQGSEGRFLACQGTVPWQAEEKEADSKRNKYREFSKFINDNYGENSIQNLFNSELSDGQKIRQIDDWWKEWQTYGK